MGDATSALAGVAFQRLVPATVLPPEDPTGTNAVRRTLREWTPTPPDGATAHARSCPH